MRGAIAVLLAVSLAGAASHAAPLTAQDSTAARPVPPSPPARPPAVADTAPAVAAPRDTVRVPARADSARRHPPGPSGSLLRSLLVPGWGQLHVHRPVTAAFFVATEALTLGMSLKFNSELQDARQLGDSALIRDKTNKREDWLVLLGVNHLLAGIEAYVSAHLIDFPDDLKLRAVPGGVAGQVALPALR